MYSLRWGMTSTCWRRRHLRRTASPRSCRRVATCRMGEPGAGEPLDDRVADLHRDRGVVTQLPLRGLSSDAIGDLIATELRSGFDHEVADDLAARVHVETGGNAFFVMELVRHLADGGSPPGLGPLPRADVPEGVKAVIEQRLRLLEPTARAVLAIAATIET